MRFFILIAFTAACFAANAKDKLSCSAKELAGKDCHLILGKYDVRLLAATVAWSDGIWHAVDPMPLKGEALSWEKITFTQIKSWPVLQFWLWGKGVGENKIESLYWFSADARKRKLNLFGEGVVRKRHPEAKGFLYDAWIKHELRPLKSGDLEWRLGDTVRTVHAENESEDEKD